MSTITPLLADGVDATIFKILIFLLVFLVPAIGQLLAKIRQVRPPVEQAPPAPVPANVADEIEEFMRRAAQQRGARPASPPSVPQTKPAAAEPVPAQAVAEPQPVGGQVSEHVRKYLDEQEFRRRSEQLGEEVAQADRQIGQHLQQVFDHRVSKLETVPGQSAAPPMAEEERSELADVVGGVPLAFGADLLDLVTSPESLRQAIILNEILHRPEERWE